MSLPSVSEATSIQVEDLSVTYRTSLERKPTLRGTLLRLGRRERVIREILDVDRDGARDGRQTHAPGT